MVRIVLGILGLLTALVSVFILPLIFGIVATGVQNGVTSTITTSNPSTTTIETSATEIYTVYVPAEEAVGARCVVASSGASLDPPTSTDPVDADGRSYVPVGDVPSSASGTVTIACPGATSVGVEEFGVGGTLVGLLAGLAIPVIIALFSLVLLISGIIGRVRSGRGR